jgi:glucose 1-dehydrogenase
MTEARGTGDGFAPVAVVTGAGTGIGKGIAVELARRGYRVVVHYHRSADGAEDTAARIRAQGGTCILHRADVSRWPEVEALAAAAVSAFGRLDVWVNNAALQTNLGLFDLTEDTYRATMATNLKGYWFGIRAAVPVMKAQGGGAIVNVSSVHAKRPTDFDPAYAMSKGAIKMLTREAAVELAPYHIRVNTVEPGAVAIGQKSGNPRPIVPPELAGRLPRRKPRFLLGRVGQPADIGHLVAFLVSPEAELITGAAVRADGGSMLL